MTHRTALTLVVTAHTITHLEEALTSVANQTTNDFELVCCADTNSGESVVDLFRERAPQIPCARWEIVPIRGGSAGRVRNAGFASARTPWVSYLDGDDVLCNDALEQIQSALTMGESDIFSTGMARIDHTGHWKTEDASLAYRPPLWIYQRDPELEGHATFFNQLLAIRRRLWETYPFYEETNGEDIDFMLHHLLNGRFQKVPKILYGYRDTPGSFSTWVYPDGDLCTRRYHSGYYSRLFEQQYRPELASNFAEYGDE